MLINKTSHRVILFKNISSGELPPSKNGYNVLYEDVIKRANIKLMTANSYITCSCFYASKVCNHKERVGHVSNVKKDTVLVVQKFEITCRLVISMVHSNENECHNGWLYKYH